MGHDLHDPALPAGTTLGPWRIEARLGTGAAATVYTARRRDPPGRAALKVLHRALLDDPTAHARFEREALALQRLEHPHVVAVLDHGRLPDGRPWLALELVDGPSLRDVLARGPLDPARAWSIARPIATALAAAHAHGIVHRDVKPDNVLLTGTPDGPAVARLVDFGLARLPPEHVRGPLTEAGVALGTPGYMSPEQWWNLDVGPATDQYALGVTVFEMLSTRLPFPAEQFQSLLRDHLTAPPPSLASAGIPVSPAIEAWLARTLAKRPDARFPSMRELIAAGDAAFALPASTSLPGATRRPSRAAVTALVLCALAPGALLALGYAGSHDPRHLAWLAGYSIWTTLLFYLLAAWTVLRLPRAGPLALHLSPALHGSVGTWLGGFVMLRHLESAPLNHRFELFHVGLAEACVNRYAGFSLGAGVILAGLARTRPADALPSTTESRAPRREALAAAAVLAALGAVALLAAAPSAALVTFTAAVAALLLGPRVPTGPESFSAAVRALVAVALAAGAALTRADARASVLWSDAPTRAARAVEIVAAARERTATLTLSVVALALTAALHVARLRRARPGTPRPTLTPRLAAALLGLAAWTALDLGLHARFAAHRDALWSALGPQFDLFARLDPPEGPRLPTPSAAPSLQLARDVVAIDSVPVGLAAALESREGAGALALDLSHRLAREPDPTAQRVQLLVSIDRTVPWRRVARALGVAYGLGVRRVEVLLTRGPRPRLEPSGPPEAAYALPRDFGAVPVILVDRADAPRFAPDAPFEALAGDLATRARRGAVPLPVAR